MTKLLADIGGTHARFALSEGAGFRTPAVYRAADFASLTDAARHYLESHQVCVTSGAFSIAATLTPGQDAVAFVNNPAWNFSRAQVQAALGLSRLDLLNDFEALAHAVPFLNNDDLWQVGSGVPITRQPIGLIGPGTGLGMAGVVYTDNRWRVITSEGGNATVPVTDARSFALIEGLRRYRNIMHVSAEDMLSGPGLENIYQAINLCDNVRLPQRDAAAIAAAGVAGDCAACVEALDIFCYLLGVVAGNLALTLTASGGIYIAGGIIPQWADYFAASRFREGFIDKGPYQDYLTAIPTYLIMHPQPALAGLCHFDAQ